MEIKTVNTDITVKKLVYEDNVEQQIESDITLPEYFSDIVRVLKCTLTPNISNVGVNGNRITADGNAVISMLYLSDDGKMHCFEQRLPFSKAVESSKIESCVGVANAKTQYVNCRVVSQRRIDIRGCITVSFKAFQKCNKNVLCGCENSSMQLKSQQREVVNLKDFVSRCFNLNETIEIGSSQGTIGQIVRCEAVAIVDSSKIVMGKILIKGELKIKVVYLTEGEAILQKIENSMPISQIVEAQTTEDCTDFITLTVSSLEVNAKTDTSGALRLVDVSAIIRADINVFENISLKYATDLYSTEYETQYKRDCIELKNISERFNDTYLCKGSVDLNIGDIKSVEDICCNSISFSTNIADNEMIALGMANISILAVNSQGEIQSCEKQVDFEYKRDVSVSKFEREAQCSATVTGVDYILSSENKLDLRIEMEMSGIVFSVEKNNIISEIACDENKKKSKRSASLTIYFAEEGEEIWDIARRYNTTLDLIRTENKLTNDCIQQKCKLYIPVL